MSRPFLRRHARLGMLALLLQILSAGTPRAQTDASSTSKVQPGGSPTVIEAIEPWKPSSDPTPKVIYGSDDRIDVYQETDARRRQLAASTCALFSASRVNDNGNGTFSLSTFNWTVSGLPPCSEEPFRTQPVAAYCTGWLAGEDIIVTAGHCMDTSQLASTTIVFGFDMLNASTPVTTVGAERVYFPIEIIARKLDSVTQEDYTVIRVDRPVTSPDAYPLPIRREGEIPTGTAVGVIGHPSGLPKKIAFGSNTRVNLVDDPVFFTANLDTYGGNSGSPVFNAATGVVEGILVRGATDYVINGSCFVSNVIPDDSPGEDCTRTSLLAEFIPELDGLTFNEPVYSCGESLELSLRDSSSTPGLPLNAMLTTSQGDAEVLALHDGVTSDVWTGTLMIVTGPVTPFDGLLQVNTSATIMATYLDPDGQGGQPVERSALAAVDCVAPLILSPPAIEASSSRITVRVETSEPTYLTLEAGRDCQFTFSAQSVLSSQHELTLSGLQPCTIYNWRLSAVDLAGNVTQYGYETPCGLGVATLEETVVFSDSFDPVQPSAWSHSAATGLDQWAVRISALAHSPSNVYSYRPGPNAIADASLMTTVTLTGNELLEFWHTYDIESGFDGAVIEARPAGGSWVDLGPAILEGGYTGTISTQYGSPISGQEAWTGGSLGTMTRVTVDLSSFTQSVGLRFRFASDDSEVSTAWEIDDVRVVSTQECDGLPPVQVISPNLGGTFAGDDLFYISALTSVARAGDLLRFELHNSSGYIDTLSTGYDPNGNFLVPVYMPLAPLASDYYIRAVSVQQPSLYDFSDHGFTITGGAVRVYRPFLGEQWNANQLVDIHWQMNPFFCGVSIEFSLWSDRFGHITDLGTDFDFDGESLYRLLVPNVLGAADYRIRARSRFNPALEAYSDTFEIVNPLNPGNSAVRNFTLYE